MTHVLSVCLRGRLFAALVAVPLALTAACDKPPVEDCQKACWNYNKIMFWAQVDEKAKDMSPEDAARLRATSEIEFKKIQERQEDPGLLNCVTNCQSQSSNAQVKCMLAATDKASMEECMNP